MNKEIQYRLEVQRNTLALVIISLVVAAVGVVLLYFSSVDSFWTVNNPLRSLTMTIGSLFLGSITVLIMWELVAKRAFLDEILSKVGISSKVRATGLLEIPFDAVDVDWASLFQNAKEVDLYFAYAKSWRGLHEVKLRTLAETSGSKIRVILPNPDNNQLMFILAEAFSKTPDKLRDRIQDAIKDFSILRDLAKTHGGCVRIFLTDIYPIFSYYRFDNVVIISLYSLSKMKTEVPHLVLAKNGSLYRFATNQFNALIDPVLNQSKEV